MAEMLLGAVFGAIATLGFVFIFGRRQPVGKTDLDMLEAGIKEYVAHVELTETKKICKCPWQIHPDDTNKVAGTRRMRRVDNDPWCPVHTREGFLKGYLERHPNAKIN